MKDIFGIKITLTRKPVNKISEDVYREKYGKFRGYFKWDLAKDWLRITNDDFFDKYGFNWVPPIWMYEQAREYL